MQYIYLIRLREFVRLNEATYKVGKTTQTPNGRLGGYPSGSEVYLFKGVSNCHELEKRILVRFKQIFVYRGEYGTETFSGPVAKMIEVIEHETALYNIETDMQSLNKTIITNIELQKEKEENTKKEPLVLLNSLNQDDQISFQPETEIHQQKIRITNENRKLLRAKYTIQLCEGCDYCFTNLIEYKEHYSRFECLDGYVCCICLQCYRSRDLLENHIKNELCCTTTRRVDIPTLKCECGHLFRSADILKFHQNEYCKNFDDRLAIGASKDIIKKCIIAIRNCVKVNYDISTIDRHIREISKQALAIKYIQEKQGYNMDEIRICYDV